MTHPTIHRHRCCWKWTGILILLALLLSTFTSATAQIGPADESTVTHDMPRPSGDEALVMDMTATVLSSREKHRLAEKIQRFEASIDLQLLIAPSVEEGNTRGYTPKEIATSLLNRWNMGSQPRNPSLARNPMGGMLVLLVMDQNRIEIVFSDSLGHLFDEDWVHDLLYTLVIPYFRNDRYGDGLARIVDATQHRLDQEKALSQPAYRRSYIANTDGLGTHSLPSLVLVAVGYCTIFLKETITIITEVTRHLYFLHQLHHLRLLSPNFNEAQVGDISHPALLPQW